jgi:peptidyl-tRNA hydrolase
MFEITDAAKKQLLAVTEQRQLSPGKFLRLAVQPAWQGEGDFGIVIDDRGVTDLSITEGNRTVLLVGPEVDEAVPNSVLDFKTPKEGPRFTLDVF